MFNIDVLVKCGVMFMNVYVLGVYCVFLCMVIFIGWYVFMMGCYGIEIYYYDYFDIVFL